MARALSEHSQKLTEAHTLAVEREARHAAAEVSLLQQVKQHDATAAVALAAARAEADAQEAHCAEADAKAATLHAALIAERARGALARDEMGRRAADVDACKAAGGGAPGGRRGRGRARVRAARGGGAHAATRQRDGAREARAGVGARGTRAAGVDAAGGRACGAAALAARL